MTSNEILELADDLRVIGDAEVRSAEWKLPHIAGYKRSWLDRLLGRKGEPIFKTTIDRIEIWGAGGGTLVGISGGDAIGIGGAGGGGGAPVSHGGPNDGLAPSRRY